MTDRGAMTDEERDALVEALAHGRDDLVADEDALVAADAELRAEVERTKGLSIDLGLLFEASGPKPLDLDAMIGRAMASAPAPVPADVEPSRRGLFWASLGGLAATAVLGLFSLGPLPSTSAALRGLRQGLALVSAVDRLVASALPGGWGTVSFVSIVLLALVLLPMRSLVTGEGGRRLGLGALRTLMLAVPLVFVVGPAGAAHALEFEGEWPPAEQVVTVSVERAPVSEVLRLAAEGAGLGLVSTLPEDPEVTLHVRDGSLRDVVEAVLGDAPLSVRRTSRMLVVRPLPAGQGASAQAPAASGAPDELPAAEQATTVGSPRRVRARVPGTAVLDPWAGSPSVAVPSVSPVPAVPQVRAVPQVPPVPQVPVPAEDTVTPERVTFGGDVHVRAGERVRGIVTMGGDAVIEGEILGDVVTMGGDVVLRRGGQVHGQVVTMGGELDIEDGAYAASVVRMEGPAAMARHRRGQRGHDDEGWFGHALDSAATHALLFMLGLLMLGLMRGRLGVLQRAMVRTPVRAGFVGILAFVAAAVSVVVLTITLIGIPGAVVVGLMTFLGGYVGMAAAATVIGAALPSAALKDRPVAQLAVGVGLLFFVSIIPFVGKFAGLLLGAVGFGAVVMTRFGKLDQRAVD